jgi:methylated-DNA-[protein]-cysteine S-methyltransferase
MTTFHETTLDTPIGRLRLFAGDEGLVGVWLPDAEDRVSRPPPWAAVPAEHHPVLDSAREQLREYFAGERRVFDLPLSPRGTEMQRAVWRALCDIPYGATRSYGQVAAAVGRPTASRAVGAANGQNPIAIIVPCHRVIGANGSLTGYGGGLACKEWLLGHERRLSQRRDGDMAETGPTPRQLTLWA